MSPGISNSKSLLGNEKLQTNYQSLSEFHSSFLVSKKGFPSENNYEKATEFLICFRRGRESRREGGVRLKVKSVILLPVLHT